MYYNPLPYGVGIYYTGQYKNDDLYPLYVQHLTFQFEIKNKHIPCLQLKHNLSFCETEYLKSDNGVDVEIWTTSTDWKLINEQYNVYNVNYLDGWKFKATTGLFKEYIEKWMAVKIEATKTNNKAMRQIAKLMLNSLYGKFALNPQVQTKIPYYDYDTNIVKYRLGEKETREPIYIPCAAFITAGARYKTITAAQSVYDRFLYADTDSLHLKGVELPKNLEISPTKLGAWKHESTFHSAKFIRQKTYMENIIIEKEEYEKQKNNSPVFKSDGIYMLQKITCAGMPEACYKNVTWDNFNIGNSFNGKLQPKIVKGGVILKDTTFKIKNKK